MKLFNLLTVYPEFFESFKSHGLIKKGLDKGLISINVINLRDYTIDKHKRVDFKPFGGGPGMIIQYAPVKEALKKNNQCIYGDNLQLPFENNCAPAVISIAVIHHFSTQERRIQEDFG